MKTTRLAVSLLFALAANAAAQSTPDLPGLWGATRRFGPDTRGPLIIYRTPEGWRADVAGFTVPVRGDRPATFAFDLPDGKGSFRNGHWIQGGAAAPVTLVSDLRRRWRGMVTPLDNRLTFYLPITRQADGTLRTYLRNPERNADRKSTRLNSSHDQISYAVFCLKKKKKMRNIQQRTHTKQHTCRVEA